MERTSTNN